MKRNVLSGSTASATAMIVAVLLLGFAVPARAATITWISAAGGAWSNPANWDLGRVPTTGDHAVLPAISGAYTVTLDTSPAVDRLDVAAGDPTLDVNGYSTGSAGFIDNSGTIVNFTGTFDSNQLANHAGGVVQGAVDGTITMGGIVTNDGTIFVGTGGSSQIYAPNVLRLLGSGKIILDHAKIVDPNPDPYGNKMTLEGGEITGSGEIDKRIYSTGTISNDGDHGNNLQINGLLMSDGGTIRVSGGATIRVDRPLVSLRNGVLRTGPGGGTFNTLCENGQYGTITLQNGGRVITDGGDLALSCGTIWDGDLETTANGGAMTFGIASWQNIHIHSGLTVTVTDVIDVKAPGSDRHLLNDGNLVLKGHCFPMIATNDSLWLDGTGVVTLDGGVLGNDNDNPNTGTIVNASGMVIQGCGSIVPPFVNDGTVNLDCDGAIAVKPGLWANHGILRANRGRMSIVGAIDNRGGVIRADGHRVNLGSPTAYGTITGGTFEASGGGDFSVLRGATLSDVTVGRTATVNVASAASAIVSGARLTNLGTLNVASGGRVVMDRTSQFVQSGGTTALAGGTLLSGREVRIEAGTLAGFGTIAGGVVNRGTVAPDAAGALRVTGNYTQLAGGALRCTIAGDDRMSRLDVSGTATLAGSLLPVLDGAYVPASGRTFDVFTYGGLVGAFDPLSAGVTPAAASLFQPRFDVDHMSLVAGGTTAVGDPSIGALRFFGRTTTAGASFVLELPFAATVKGAVYDAAGREVAKLADGAQPAGLHTFALDRAAGLASGVYFARVHVAASGTTSVRSARAVVLQ